MRTLLSCALAAAVFFALQGCATPKTVSFYDEQCNVVARKMVLEAKNPNVSANCSDKECLGELLGAAVVLTTTTVISGSIVVAGNVVYWLEKQKNCQPSKTIAEPALPKSE